ncbi:squalene/phytoene synthase family protein [Alkalihalobacterium elongatum]|uniref:squalene/phytoene synthase family protein n=1 Tax=Alkalihalobacterium elongatum TaxID=2675466 RepID=UPI001C1F7197|nr:phytoene/squalene synthase family protein [Alkalihalobacterium elongatum]
MTENTKLYDRAKRVLMETSRTFFIPISKLPDELEEAVMSAYLCMRAIDEIEDSPSLSKEIKVNLLNKISIMLKNEVNKTEFNALFDPYKSSLPEVTLQLNDWITLCPESASQAVVNATSEMAEGMGKWVNKAFKIDNKEDLDEYTYYVAGLVGVMLSDLWRWYDGTECDRDLAIGFGRGLQAVNMIRNRDEDLSRDDVDFFPNGWDMKDMFEYARKNLELGDEYTKDLTVGPVYYFCKIPLALAFSTLDAIEAGQEKLTRNSVMEIVNEVIAE